MHAGVRFRVMVVPQVGLCFDRTFPPSAVVEFAEHADRTGLDQL